MFLKTTMNKKKMKQPTLFLSPRYTPDSRLMRDAAVAAGWQVVRMTSWTVPEPLPAPPVVVYGETLFCRYLAEHFKITLTDPGDTFLEELPEHLRRRRVRCTTAGAARAEQERCFIKPVNDKTFRAAVFENGSALPATVENHEVVLVSEPVVFSCEFRFFVMDGKVQAGSLYARYGESEEEDATPDEFAAAKQIAEEAAAFVTGAVVIDTGYIEGRGWAVVEANPAWASGLYLCDAARVLEVIKAACLNTH